MNYSLDKTTKLLNITKDSLRYYEKIGLITAKRKENNYRYYNEEDILKLKYIKVMKFNGFTLKEIASILKYFHIYNEDICFDSINKLIMKKRQETLDKINSLEKSIVLFDEVLMIKNSLTKDSIERLDNIVNEIEISLEGNDIK